MRCLSEKKFIILPFKVALNQTLCYIRRYNNTNKEIEKINNMSQVVEKSAKKGNKKQTYSKETYLKWFELMFRIRKFEERALMMYSKQKIRGFLHVYIGQEAIAAGMLTGIRPEDAVVTAYRQHGTALSRGLTSRACMAELFGKATGAKQGEGRIHALLL